MTGNTYIEYDKSNNFSMLDSDDTIIFDIDKLKIGYADIKLDYDS
jgi:hypothetical protein